MNADEQKGLYADFAAMAKGRIENLKRAHDYLACAFIKASSGHDVLAGRDVHRALSLMGVESEAVRYNSKVVLDYMGLCDQALVEEKVRLSGLEGEILAYGIMSLFQEERERKLAEGDRAARYVTSYLDFKRSQIHADGNRAAEVVRDLLQQSYRHAA